MSEFDQYLKNVHKTPKDYYEDPITLESDKIIMACVKFCGCCLRYRYIAEFCDTPYDNAPQNYCLDCQ